MKHKLGKNIIQLETLSNTIAKRLEIQKKMMYKLHKNQMIQ